MRTKPLSTSVVQFRIIIDPSSVYYQCIMLDAFCTEQTRCMLRCCFV